MEKMKGNATSESSSSTDEEITVSTKTPVVSKPVVNVSEDS